MSKKQFPPTLSANQFFKIGMILTVFAILLDASLSFVLLNMSYHFEQQIQTNFTTPPPYGIISSFLQDLSRTILPLGVSFIVGSFVVAAIKKLD